MALKESLVGLWLFLLLCDGARLNVPRVLLPYRQEVATNYSLELIDASPGACYHWSSSQPDLVSVQPVNGDPCALQALVSAVSHHPARRTAIVTADNSATGEVLRCDVIVDRVHSLEVMTTTRELLLDDSPEMMEVVAHNDQGDTFSSLDGVSFEWSILSEPSAGTQGAVVRFLQSSESPYQSPPGVQFWEQRGLQGWAVLAQGVGTGSARIAVRLAHPDYKEVPGKQVTLLVVANVLLEPSRVFLLEGARIHFGARLVRKGTASELELPSDQYSLHVEDPLVAELDGFSSSVTARSLGHTSMVLRDSHLTLHEYSRQPRAEIYVVKPSYLLFSVTPGDTWGLQEDTEYCVQVGLFDEHHHRVHLSQNLVVTVDFPLEHMEVLSSTENGTHHCVRTKGPATTRITGRLEGFRTPAGAIRKAAYEIKGFQEVSIYKRIVVQPPVLLFPWDPVVKPSYSPQARASGGTGSYRWYADNSSVARVNFTPDELSGVATVVTTGPGRTAVVAQDAFNSFSLGKALVSVQPVAELEIVPSLLETDYLNEVLVPVALYGYEDSENKTGRRVFDDCSQIPLTVEVVDEARFLYVQGSHGPPLGQGCLTLRFSCKSVGHSRVYVSYRDGELDLKSTTVLGCHKTLKAVHPAKTVVVAYGSFKDVAFEGGPRPWPMLKQGHYVKLVADNTSLVSIMRIIDPYRNNRECPSLTIVFLGAQCLLDVLLYNSWKHYFINVKIRMVTSFTVSNMPREFYANQTNGSKVCLLELCIPLQVIHDRTPVRCSSRLKRAGVGIEPRIPGFCSASFRSTCSELVCARPLGHRSPLASGVGVAFTHRRVLSFRCVLTSMHLTALPVTNSETGQRHRQHVFHLKAPTVHNKRDATTWRRLNACVCRFASYSRQASAQLLNRQPCMQASVSLQDGSGSFQLECSDPAKAKVTLDAATRQIKVVPLGEGSVSVRVHDLCLDLPPLTLEVQLVGLARLHLHTLTKVELGQEIEAHVELEDSLGQSLPASVLDLVGLRPLLGSPLLEIRPLPGEGDRVRFAVRGSSLGTTSLQFVAGGPGANQVASEALSVQVFAPLKLDPRNITLVVGATFQLWCSGGPQPEGQVEFSLEGNASVASVSTSGVVTASALGNVSVTARSLDSDSGVVYSQDMTSVHVVALTSIRIQPALSRMLSGTELPAFATGSNEFETPFSFCSAEPPLLFRWSVSDPRLLALEAPLVQEGLQPREENVCAVRLRALGTPGRVALRLQVSVSEDAPDASRQQLLDNAPLDAQLQIQILPSLELVNPSLPGTGPILLTPHAKLRLKSSRDREGSVAYALERPEHASLRLEEGPLLVSGAHTGSAVLNVSLAEPFGLVHRILTPVEVRPASFLQGLLEPCVRQETLPRPTLPLGLSCPLAVSLHDELGRRFHATGTRLAHRSSRRDLVRVSEGAANGSLALHCVAAGRTVLRLWDRDDARLQTFVSLRTGPALEPRPDRISVGDVVCFQTPLQAANGGPGVWSQTGDQLVVEPGSGVAVALRPGTAVLRYSVAPQLHSTLQVLVHPVATLELLPGRSQLTSLAETRLPVLLASQPSNVHGGSACSSRVASELAVVPPFSCSVEFVNSTLEASAEDFFAAEAGFSFAQVSPTPGYFCALRPRAGADKPHAVLEAQLEVRATLGSDDDGPWSSAPLLFTGPFELHSREVLLSPDQPSTSVLITAGPATHACLRAVSSDESRLEVVGLRAASGRAHTWSLALQAHSTLLWRREPLGVTLDCPATGQREHLVVRMVPLSPSGGLEPDLGWPAVLRSFWAHHQFWLATLVIGAATAALLLGYRNLLGQQSAVTRQPDVFLNTSGEYRSPSGVLPYVQWPGSPERLWSVPDPHWSPSQRHSSPAR
ncbi:unnamed protein product [Ixodes persulcatus]